MEVEVDGERKVSCSEKSLSYIDGRVRFGVNDMNPSRLASTGQVAGCVMVWGMFFWYTLGCLIQTGHRVNATLPT